MTPRKHFYACSRREKLGVWNGKEALRDAVREAFKVAALKNLCSAMERYRCRNVHDVAPLLVHVGRD